MRSEARTSSAASITVTAALVAAGCALGASAGLFARFPGLGAAILFLPYAIVTAALLRSAPRHWPIILFAAAVGNFVPHWRSGESVAFVLLAEGVNDARALIAALGIRRYATRSGRLESMREMLAYLVVAVLVAPALAALGGVGLAWLFRTSAGFWLVWQQWWLSNAITGLIVLPLLTIDFRALLSGGVRLPARRVAEAGLLAASMLIVGAAVFARSYDRSPTHQAHLYWALPFLLWAAVRFGARGTCAALMGVTSLSVWGAIAGRGPFAPDASTENLLELQVFLVAVSIPVLLLASLIEQQRRTAAALTEIEKRKSVEAALRESNRRKDEFLAMLGHELRNPLAPISIALQILREAPPASRDAAWARESIGRQLNHMTRLLDDLLDISRVTLGKIQLQLASRSAGSGHRERGGGDAPAHRLGRAPADGRAARRLGGDSRRRRAPDAGRREPDQQRGQVHRTRRPHRRRRRPRRLRGSRSVRDNGIGIAAEPLERIFDLFSQLPGGHERAEGGLGIGLTLARRLVEMHGGTVEARSEGANRGTEIVVRLPLTAFEAAPRPAGGRARRRGEPAVVAADPGRRRQRPHGAGPGEHPPHVGTQRPHRA